MTDDPSLPTPEEILIMHEKLKNEYEMKYTGHGSLRRN